MNPLARYQDQKNRAAAWTESGYSYSESKAFLTDPNNGSLHCRDYECCGRYIEEHQTVVYEVEKMHQLEEDARCPRCHGLSIVAADTIPGGVIWTCRKPREMDWRHWSQHHPHGRSEEERFQEPIRNYVALSEEDRASLQ